MRSFIQITLLLSLSAAAVAADDTRVTRLEQDVRTLQREVQALSRQVDGIRLQTTRPSADGAAQTPVPGIASNPDWVDAAKWKRVHVGMTELEVIATLGAPSSTRETNGVRQLLYAMEIGTASFLAGSVALRNGAVTGVTIPTLK